MAWVSPKTFAANSSLTAADLNTYLRDNMLETSANKAVTPSGMFISTGLNGIAERVSQYNYVGPNETTTSNSASYVDLATPGPSVTVATSARAMVFIYCQAWWLTTRTQAMMSYVVSGATTVNRTDNSKAIVISHPESNKGQFIGAAFIEVGLNPGSNTFTAKYRSGASGVTCHFSDRRIAVFPF